MSKLEELGEIDGGGKLKKVIEKFSTGLSRFLVVSQVYIEVSLHNINELEESFYRPIRKDLDYLAKEISLQRDSVSSIDKYLQNVDTIFTNEVSCLAQDPSMFDELKQDMEKLENYAFPISNILNNEERESVLSGTDKEYEFIEPFLQEWDGL